MENKGLKVSENNSYNENKRFKRQLRSDIKKRQSFDYRICDDLCEVLLSYLSFEDKIRFECVSKQFQRCVYNKQNAICIGFSGKDSLNRLRINQSINIDIFDAFEDILIKWEFINKININIFYSLNVQISSTINY
jgi:hypothetical protein